MDHKPMACGAELCKLRSQPGHVGSRRKIEPASVQFIWGFHRHTRLGHGTCEPAFACLELQEQDGSGTRRLAA